MSQLGLAYRRIPILAIGRDVYLDSSLQIAQLDSTPPNVQPSLSSDPNTPEQQAIQWLVSRYVCKVAFRTASTLLPLDHGFLTDPVFVADRAKLLGFDFRSSVVQRQPAATSEVLATFELLETTLLTDGREWLLKTERPTTVDIEAIWPIVWLDEIENALPPQFFGPDRFPLVYGWLERFKVAVKIAQESLGHTEEIAGAVAAESIHNAPAGATQEQARVDTSDPVALSNGLKRGQQVSIWTNDVPGHSQKDSGKLLGFDHHEIVIQVQKDAATFQLHAPSGGFNIEVLHTAQAQL